MRECVNACVNVLNQFETDLQSVSLNRVTNQSDCTLQCHSGVNCAVGSTVYCILVVAGSFCFSKCVCVGTCAAWLLVVC